MVFGNMTLSYCPLCGGYMEYDKYDDDLCCDTCGYAIRGIMCGQYLEDFSDVDFDD